MRAESLQIVPLIFLNYILETHEDVFNRGIIKLPFFYHIKLEIDTPPTVEPVRRVPVAIKRKLKAILDEMEAHGDLLNVSDLTDWSLPYVNIKKNDKVKIAMDKRLNQFVEREVYRILPSSILYLKLNGARFFTVLDASHAFAQIPVDEETSYKLVIEIPFGGYSYLILPYRLPSSSEVLQHVMDTIFSGQEHTAVYMLTTEAEHDSALITMLETVRKMKLYLSKNKIHF